MDKFVLIDGNSLINRAFYAMPLLTNSNNEYCNALYGFTNMIIKLINEQNPKYMAVAFDLKHPTFRHEMYKDYKAKRNAAPPELIEQLESIKKILKAMKIKVVELKGYEADDLIGTLSKQVEAETIIVSGDKDLFQLISDNVTVWHTKRGITDVVALNKERLMEYMEITPSQIIDLKSLMGDSSDNIPGVPGIGEKTAINLIKEYGNLENIYNHLDELKNGVRTKLIDGQESAEMSKTLATINVNVPIEYSLDECLVKFPFDKDVLDIFKHYEFNSIIKKTELFDESASEAKTKDIPHIIIKTQSQLQELLQEITKVNEISFHIGENVNIALSRFQEYEIVSQQNLLDECMPLGDIIKQLKDVFEDEKIKKVCYDVKEQMHILSKFTIKLNGTYFDTNLASYLINGSKRNGRIIKYFMPEFYYPNYAIASCLLQAKFELEKSLKDFEMEELYYNLELPLISVLYEMEEKGFKVDVNELTHLEEIYAVQMKDIIEQIYQLAGEEFNINSTKKLAEILFDKLHLPSPKKQSTAVEVLEKLVDLHPIIPLILRYRKIFKLKGTYIDSLLKLVDSTGLIHTVFHQTLTSTGRLSSTEPNLQNIPIRDEEGKLLRKIFIPRSENGYIISADYSQIELRILAHYSNDASLIEAYKNGIDIHTKTASDVFNVPIEEVTSKMRADAKAVNFGVIYGMTDFGLSENLGISRKQAKEYIETYFEKYKGIKEFMKIAIEQVKETGYATSLLGRKRKVDEINSSNYVTRQFGERVAMNMPFQGTAADIIKLAMVNVYKRMKKENLKSSLILQIHDELIIDATSDEKDIVVKILREEMENVVKLNVPLVVDISVGTSWFDAK